MRVTWCSECGAEHRDAVARCAECGGEIDRVVPHDAVDAVVVADEEGVSVPMGSGAPGDDDVDVEPDLSNAVRRLCAAAIDLLLLGLVLSAAMVPFLADRLREAADGRPAGSVGMSVTVDLVFGAYFVVFAARSGATIGKRLMGLVVVADDGGPLGWRRAGLRYGVVLGAVVVPELLDVAGVSAEVSAIAWTVSLAFVFLPIVLSDDGAGVHDRLTGTRVVRTR